MHCVVTHPHEIDFFVGKESGANLWNARKYTKSAVILDAAHAQRQLLARRRRYHTERYQTKALKERVKELEAEVARVTDLLDSERKGSEVLNSQVTRLGNFRRFSLGFRPPWG